MQALIGLAMVSVGVLWLAMRIRDLQTGLHRAERRIELALRALDHLAERAPSSSPPEPSTPSPRLRDPLDALTRTTQRRPG
jgi:hypothetical protein